MGNDAKDMSIATTNCSFCAVGGLFNKTANEVMTRVYALLGKAGPAEGEECGTAWVQLYEKLTGKKAAEKGQGYLDGQLNGIKLFVEACGCKTNIIGTVYKPLKKSGIVSEAAKLRDGTAFLLLTADDDGLGMGSLAHWVCGQVQDGTPKFFDYQLKFLQKDTMDAVGRTAARRGNSISGKASQSTPYTSDEPLSPWGAEQDDDDGRGVLLTVTK
jgi:hypothetical protein